MKTNWWDLKTTLDQEQFYNIIHAAKQHDYKNENEI